MTYRKLILPFLIIVALYACNKKGPESAPSGANPPAEGFDMSNSDPAAVELADSIMAAMGGRENWDKTRFISWNFFGARDLVWDKQMGRVRIEDLKDSITYLVDLNTVEGRVRVKGQEITLPDSLKKMLHKAKSMWINDSYWLVMPFKLKDSGVTLKYMGEDTLRTGPKCNVLQLTFSSVGDTPQNKYLVYVDMTDNLVKQWSYFNQANQDSANFTRPWDNYQKYGNVLLSADRSDGGGPKNVKVDESLSETLFKEF
ncbi:MAG: hypothetical protein C0490_06810 [Marivirga sp.]|nr:hypothetical protein [Marivirga sp.]